LLQALQLGVRSLLKAPTRVRQHDCDENFRAGTIGLLSRGLLLSSSGFATQYEIPFKLSISTHVPPPPVVNPSSPNTVPQPSYTPSTPSTRSTVPGAEVTIRAISFAEIMSESRPLSPLLADIMPTISQEKLTAAAAACLQRHRSPAFRALASPR
jgi:hypothetical protein